MTSAATAQLSRYHEVVVRISSFRCPPPAAAPVLGSGERAARVYQAWIYSRLALPVRFGEIGTLPPGGLPAPPPEIGGLPLIGREEVAVPLRNYADYLGTFYEGEEAILEMRSRLEGSFSSGLMGLLRLRPRPPRRLRIWWSSESPELEDLPWELVALGAERPPGLSIVRGSPGKPVPPHPLPQGRPLRVAVIDPTCSAPTALWEALKESPARGLEFVWLDEEDPRKAISEAARADIEVIHLVADASVPLGVEATLEFPGDEDESLLPSELASMLRGSSVAIVALTPPEIPRVSACGMPSVFHAFARIGHDAPEGPTLIAQLCPMLPRASQEFWSVFYQRLAETLDAEDALTVASPRPIAAPVVLFLQHRLGRQFSRKGDESRRSATWPTHGAGETPEDVAPLTPSQVTADLSVSRDLVDAARALQARYAALGLDFPGKDLIEKECERLAVLDAALDEAIFEDMEHEDP